MIIYQSDKLLVVDKPAGLTVSDLAERMKSKVPQLENLPRYGLVHRIDKDTSGILLFGKDKKAFKDLQGQFKKRKVKKKYLCLVWRKMKSSEGEIVTAMRRGGDRRKHQSYPPEEKGRKAVSYYKVLENFENYSLIEVKPITGRRHQIRSQFAFLGHPVVGDKLYGFKDQVDPIKINRHFLHSSFLEISMENKKKRFVSPLPEELKEVINKIKCQKK